MHSKFLRRLGVAAACSVLLACADEPPAPVTTTVGTASVDACGARVARFAFQNPSDAPTPFSAEVTPDSFGTVSPREGTVAAHENVTFTVVVDSAVAPPASAKLAIHTGDTTRVVDVELAKTTTALAFNAPSLDFADAEVGEISGPVAVDVQNQGAAPADVSFVASAEFMATWAGGAATARIEPGQSRTAILRFAPGSIGDRSSRIHLVVNGATCADAGLDVHGNGVSSVIKINPDNLDWGSVDCGQSAPPTSKVLEISNTSNESVAFDLGFPEGVRFSATPRTGTIAAKSSVKISVGLTPFDNGSYETSVDFYAADLVVHTSVKSAITRLVRNHVTARGARLYFNAPVDFGNVHAGTTGTATVMINNDGNADATVTPTFFQNNYPWGVQSSALVPKKGSVIATLSNPTSYLWLGKFTETWWPVTKDPVCAYSSSASAATIHVYDRGNAVAVMGMYAAIIGDTGHVYPRGFSTQLASPSTPAVEVAVTQNGYCSTLQNGGAVCEGTIGGVQYAQTPIVAWANAWNLVAGADHVCAIVGGTVSCLGSNAWGQLGNGTTTPSATPVPSLANVQRIAATGATTCAIDWQHVLHCWGDGSFNRFGVGGPASSNVPFTIALPWQVDDVALAVDQTVVLRNSQASWWGASPLLAGPLDLGGPGTQLSWPSGSCAIRGSGNVACFGHGASGVLGDGIFSDHFVLSPQDVWIQGPFLRVASGSAGAYAIASDHRVWAWIFSTPALLPGFD